MPMPSPAPTLVWLRRDLRLHDHAALELACRDGAPVLLAFVFDHRHPGRAAASRTAASS